MQKQLANGLILRTLSEGIASDREQLPQFTAEVNGEGDPEIFQKALGLWSQDLINSHPLTSHDDIFVIVDPAHNSRIVSSTLLIPQTWRYEDIEISVGRPELVATLPEYRGKGLVRALFTAIHERSAALGNQVLAITGIPHFYRQFGYTMALDLGHWASIPMTMMDDPAPEYTPAFTLRPTTLDDIPNLIVWHNRMGSERLVSEIRSAEYWRHELTGHTAGSLRARNYLTIVNAAGEGVGYIEQSGMHNKKYLYCYAYVVGDQASYLETFNDVMRGTKQWAEATYGACPPLMLFAAGGHQSIYSIIGRSTGGDVRQSTYRWYLRVPDPVAFLRHIQPVLERRLECSGAHRYTGALKIGFLDLTGVELKFEKGRITEIAPLKGKDGYDAEFPWNLFWNVVFGDQTADELNALLPDVEPGGGRVGVLLETLFPKKKSWFEGLA